MKPLTDRFRNRLNTMARETKNATKKQKMKDALKSLVAKDEMTMSVIKAEQSMRLTTPEKGFSQDVARGILDICCDCTFTSEDTNVSK